MERATRLSFLSREPRCGRLAAGGFAHEAELVVAGDAGGMDLDELAVGVDRSLLVERGLGGAGADDGVGGLAEDGPDAAGADDDGVGGEGSRLHGAEIEGADAATDAVGVEDGGEELPAFVLRYFAFRLVATDLLVEGVEELLAGCCACKRWFVGITSRRSGGSPTGPRGCG